MAYATSNPPALLVQRAGSNSGAVWWYRSADAIAAVDDANYFSNARDLGMRQNDVIIIENTAGNLVTLGKVGAISTAGAAGATTALTAVP